MTAIYGNLEGRDVKRMEGTTMCYNHDTGTGLTAAEMLAHPTGSGQCTAWADLLVQVLGAQGIGATSTRIEPDSPYLAFRVQLMPAQGSGEANYTETDFGFHQVVRVEGFSDSIFDPSYGTRVDKTDARSVELKYEDENVTHLEAENPSPPPNYVWVADPKGVANLTFTP